MTCATKRECRRVSRLGPFLLLLLLIPSPLGAAPAGPAGDLPVSENEQRARAVLAAPGLDRAVTVEEPKIPLGELVARVAAATGVAVTTAREVADEPVVVAVRQFPARELLVHLADLLDYTWSRRGEEKSPRYEIWQDLASKKREEALRRAVYDETEARFREELSWHARLAALSQEEIQALWAEGRKREQTLAGMAPAERSRFLDRPEEKERTRRLSLTPTLWPPINRALARLLAGMTPGQWETLLQEEGLTFSASARPGLPRLPSAIVDAFRAGRPQGGPPELAAPNPDPAAAEQAQEYDRNSRERWAAATDFLVRIKLSGPVSMTDSALELQARAQPIASGDPILWGGDGGPGTSVNVSTRTSEMRQRFEEDTPERQAGLERDPVLGARRLLKTAVKAGDPLGLGVRSLWWLRDVLPDVGRAWDVQIVGDAYWSSARILSLQRFLTEKTPLHTFLDAYQGITHRWERRGNLIRLRSRSWFFERPIEIPLRLVRRWQEQFAAGGSLSLEECVELATSLTDAQLRHMDEAASQIGLPREWRDLFMIASNRHALRLYAALLPDQRDALWRGEALSVARMAPAPRRHYLAAIKEFSRERRPPLDLEAWRSGSFALTHRPLVRVVTRQGESIRMQDEPARGEEGAPTAQAPAPPGAAVTRHPITRIDFHCRLGAEPETDVGQILYTAGRGGSSPARGQGERREAGR